MSVVHLGWGKPTRFDRRDRRSDRKGDSLAWVRHPPSEGDAQIEMAHLADPVAWPQKAVISPLPSCILLADAFSWLSSLSLILLGPTRGGLLSLSIVLLPSHERRQALLI
jgi:hypothetical protein